MKMHLIYLDTWIYVCTYLYFYLSIHWFIYIYLFIDSYVQRKRKKPHKTKINRCWKYFGSFCYHFIAMNKLLLSDIFTYIHTSTCIYRYFYQQISEPMLECNNNVAYLLLKFRLFLSHYVYLNINTVFSYVTINTHIRTSALQKVAPIRNVTIT